MVFGRMILKPQLSKGYCSRGNSKKTDLDLNLIQGEAKCGGEEKCPKDVERKWRIGA